MWIMTTFGFFSVVEKEEDRGTKFVTVRARVRRDLESLLKRSPFFNAKSIVASRPGGVDDYRFRARVDRNELASVIFEALVEIDYENFKSSVLSKQGKERAAIYNNVWYDLLRLQQHGAAVEKTGASLFG